MLPCSGIPGLALIVAVPRLAQDGKRTELCENMKKMKKFVKVRLHAVKLIL